MTAPPLRVGVDLVQISTVVASIERFGDHYLRRIFTDDEIAYARSAPSQAAERLAARFAAKEATIKALQMAELGINLRDIEVRRLPSGTVELSLHGIAADVASRYGKDGLAVSLSHEGDYAMAVVVAGAREHRES